MARKNDQYEVRSADHFRNRISSVDSKGKRVWMFPKLVKGRFYKYRSYFSLGLLLILFGVPFIEINDNPLFMLNVIERKFIILGKIFWPQDFLIFMLFIVTFIIFIVLFTVIYGRLFCGWACPQTVFMEMVFRRIEYWIDGNHIQQKKLKEGPWTSEKVRKRALKYGIYVFMAFLVGNLFMAYIVGKDEVFEIVTSSPLENLTGFLLVLAFTGITFFNFAYFREQVCTVVCPYGRLQGVFLDKKSVVVAYDDVRGEPRERPSRKRTEEAGDCIDCFACVDVCPTGIDIRNGTQLECVNCTACIDACDEIMDKIKKPRGLVRFASETDIKEGKSFKLNARSAAYSSVLLVLLSILAVLLFNRSDISSSFQKLGQGFTELDGKIVNLYQFEVANKTFESVDIEIKIDDKWGANLMMAGNSLTAEENSISEAVVKLEIPKDRLESRKTKLEVEIWSEGEMLETAKLNFIGPSK